MKRGTQGFVRGHLPSCSGVLKTDALVSDGTEASPRLYLDAKINTRKATIKIKIGCPIRNSKLLMKGKLLMEKSTNRKRTVYVYFRMNNLYN